MVAPTITIIGFALFTEFQAIDQCFFIQNLWFNHNYGGRTQFAPTETIQILNFSYFL